ncbi:MAG: hypothetical protein H6719_27680 [Sandaracinaceae bacterium]|nr:hypothetical protein [Sandaracinaceae bacterium]
MSERLRVGWPVLVVLLVVLAGFAFVAYRTFEGPLGSDRRPEPARSPGEPETWVHHAWVEDAGPPPASIEGRRIPAIPPGMSEAAHDQAYDPQRWAMLRQFRIGPGDAGVELPFEPMERAASITQLEGALPFGEDARCTARLLPARSGRYDCLVRVICDGHVIYPNPTQTAGYVDCEVDDEGRPLRAEDVGHTAVDGDPRLRVDLTTSEMTVSDAGDGVDAFTVRLRLR